MLSSGLSSRDGGLLSSIVPTAQPNDQFSAFNVSGPLRNGDDEDSDSDDFDVDVEHIDEQEIYGR